MDNLKTKSVLIADHGLFMELAPRLAREFGEVKLFLPWASGYPKAAPAFVGTGIEGVDRVETFWDHVPDADMVVFPDLYFSDWQEVVSGRFNKPTWGHRRAESLELDRWGTRKLQRDLGIDAPKTRHFIGIDALADYLKGSENKWVKISTYRGDAETWKHNTWHTTEVYLTYFRNRVGALADQYEFIVEDDVDGIEIGYDGFTVNGKWPEASYWGFEVKDCGYIGKFSTYKDLPKPIRDINDKVSPILEVEKAVGFCSFEFRLTKDGSALMIDPCFSDDTEILTNKGWRRFYDLDRTESVATLNTDTREIEYQMPTDYIAHQYTGDMVQITTPKGVIDVVVTPNHGVWRTDRDNRRLFVERADSLTDRGFIPRSGVWRGIHRDTFTLPRYEVAWESGRKYLTVRYEVHEEVIIPMDDWLRFLGWYLSEGSAHGKWGVNITQKKEVELVGLTLARLPFHTTRNGDSFVIHSVQLASHLRQFGLCNAKHVPDYIKALTPEQIRIFLESYLLGDGSIHKGQRLWYTSSRQMADDIQELVFKTGSVASIICRQSKGTEMVSPRGDGKVYIRNHDMYVVCERAQWKDCWFETGCRKDRYITNIPYNGTVYDVTVPNHTVYVRRNGKPFWSSNCMRAGSPPFEGVMEGYDNLGEIIWEGAHGRIAPVRSSGEFVAIAMMHSTFALTNWVPLEIPPSIKKWVKVRNLAVIDGKTYHVPTLGEMPEIGAVVAVADDLDEAKQLVKERAEQVKGYLVEIHTDALDAAGEEIDKAKEYGIDF